jgi:mycofactocin system glycosyltransferase
MAVREPYPLPVRLDADAQRLDGGRALLAGSPVVLFRLGGRGQRVVDAMERGDPLDADARPLVERLIDTGAAHPQPAASAGPGRDTVTVVVPALGPLPAELLAALGGTAGAVVVDDASVPPLHVEGTTVVRHPVNQGPAAARNSGLIEVRTELVAFVDTDCIPAPGWLDVLLPHFADPRVALAAPRVRSRHEPGASALHRYEERRSPLDLGERPARVAPGTRVAYVPGAAFLARSDALRAVGGWETALRVGEDVDLVWRLHAAGWRLRYEPAASVVHAPRPRLRGFIAQRAAYGSSAGPLACRHGDAVTPVRAAPLSLAGWLVAAAGHAPAGTAIGLAGALPLAWRMRLGREGAATAAIVSAHSHLATGRQLAGAVTRPWWPLAAAAAIGSRRARTVVALAALVPALIDYVRTRPVLDPGRYLALRLLDDAAYGVGVWRGAAAAGTVIPFVPTITRRGGSARRGPLRARRAPPD